MRDDKRTSRVELRVTEDELETMRANAHLSGLSLTQFLVERGCNGRIRFALATAPEPPRSRGATRVGGDIADRCESVSIRTTPGEHDHLAALARKAGLSMTDYILQCTMHDRRQFLTVDREVLQGILTELRRQGNNLNQMSIRLNHLDALCRRDDVDGSSIDRLVSGLSDDNRRTRTALNDALRAVFGTLRFGRDGTTSNPS